MNEILTIGNTMGESTHLSAEENSWETSLCSAGYTQTKSWVETLIWNKQYDTVAE